MYVLNRSSTKSLEGKTPYKMWSRKEPKLSHLGIFCSIVYVKTLGALGNFKDKNKDMVFVGYERGTKGYWCFDPTTRKNQLSHDVIFEERHKWNFIEGQPSEGMSFLELCVSSIELRLQSPRERMQESRVSVECVLYDVHSNEQMGQSPRSTSTSNEGMERYRSSNLFYEAINLIEEESLISFEKPATYSKASQEEVWRKTMEEEIASIKKNDTWTLVKAPKASSLLV